MNSDRVEGANPRYPSPIPDRWVSEILLASGGGLVGLTAYYVMEDPTMMQAVFVYSACVTAVLVGAIVEWAGKEVWGRVR